MIRNVYPLWVSYKNRKVKIDKEWIKVASHVDLNEIRVKQINSLRFAEGLDGNLLIVEKVNADKTN